MGQVVRVACLVLSLVVFSTVEADASFSVKVDWNGSTALYDQYYAQVYAGLNAAAADWGQYIQSSGVLEIQVNITNEATGSGGSLFVTPVGNQNGITTYEQGALAKITDGVDNNPNGPDAVLNIGLNWLTNVLYYNPDPLNPNSGPPPGMVDSHYFFLHEMGHMLAFNGWRDGTNGTLPGNYQSTFDALTVFENGNFYFVGQQAMAVYGGKVPLTFNNIFHLGNSASSGRPGADLVDDVMNGVVSQYKRYDLSALDLAILADVGAPMVTRAVPEPSSLVALSAGASLMIVARSTRRRRRAA